MRAFFMIVISTFLFSSCGEDEPAIVEFPSQSWNILLDGQAFNVPRHQHSAIYDSFSGDLVVVGNKGTTERIVFILSVDNDPPFSDGQSMSLESGSGYEAVYYNAGGDKYSSHSPGGTGTYKVNKYIEGESRNHLSGTVNAVLFNEMDGSSVTVTGSLASNTF